MKRVFAEYDQDIDDQGLWSWDCPACGVYEEEGDIGQKSKVVQCEECEKTYLVTFFKEEQVGSSSFKQAAAS